SVAGAGIPFSIRVGSTLVVDVGENQESVQVTAVDARAKPPTVTAVFTKPHAAGAPVSLAETPGEPPVCPKPVAGAGLDAFREPPYPITVRVAVYPGASTSKTLVGEYNGIRWKLQPGAKLLLDVGPDQEVVSILPEPFALDPASETASFRVI